MYELEINNTKQQLRTSFLTMVSTIKSKFLLPYSEMNNEQTRFCFATYRNVNIGWSVMLNPFKNKVFLSACKLNWTMFSTLLSADNIESFKRDEQRMKAEPDEAAYEIFISNIQTTLSKALGLPEGYITIETVRSSSHPVFLSEARITVDITSPDTSMLRLISALFAGSDFQPLVETHQTYNL
ncbi:MAG: hypothetical protein GY774_35280 [Planctomycetes bacterium]|nr:hypothetical protein [Planctomycetota bacterium]